MKLSAVEVLFLHFLHGKRKRDLIIYDFWTTEYNIEPLELLDALIDKGAVHKTQDLSYTLTQFTVPIIKDLLKKSGIKLSGNKQDLIERVKLNASLIDLSHLHPEAVYIVDDSLNDLMQNTTFLNYINLYGPIGIEDAFSYYLQHQDMNESELIISIHETHITETMNKTNKYDAIKCHHLLTEYYSSKCDDFDKRLYHLNHFSMLIVLESIQRYLQIDDPSTHYSFFNIDNYTIEKYRDMLLMKQLDINTLYDRLLEHTEALPYAENFIKLAAQYIIRCVIGSSQAEDKLIQVLEKFKSK